MLCAETISSTFHRIYIGDWFRAMHSFYFPLGDLSRLTAVRNVIGEACPDGVDVTLTRRGVAIF